MTGERVVPGGAALEAYHTLGSDNWDAEWNANLLKIAGGIASVLVVKSQVTVLPVSPSIGDIYIVKDGEANEKQIAIWDGPVASEVWNYFPAYEGLQAYPLDTKIELLFDGTDWNAVASGAPSMLRVGRSSDLLIPNATNTLFTPDVEVTDDLNVYAIGTNPTRVLALGTGRHRVTVHMEWQLSAAVIHQQFWFNLNRAGATTFNADFPELFMESTQYGGGANISKHVYWGDTINLTAGDYIELVVFQSSGAGRNLGDYSRVTLEFLG